MSSKAISLYFHGVPGRADELNLFGPEIAARSSHFAIAPRDFPSVTSSVDRFEGMAEAIEQSYPSQRLRLIGFSLGAAAVLRVSAVLGAQVESIDIVSAAAPLQLGDFLGDMAGAPVFRYARDYPFVFSVLSRGQSWLAKASPSTLYSALFASAASADIALRQDPCFRAIMIRQLRECLVNDLANYRYEVQSYVTDWSRLLSQISQPVSIYHGSDDNWSPVAMATALASSLQSCQRLEIMNNRSHYSTLQAFLQRC